jgi:hypothetical protein
VQVGRRAGAELAADGVAMRPLARVHPLPAGP